MFIDFNTNKDKNNENTINVPVIRLSPEELDNMKEFIEMAKKQKIKNPATLFTQRVERDYYSSLSDEEFEEILEFTRLISLLWSKDPNNMITNAVMPIYEVSAGSGDEKAYIVPCDASSEYSELNIYQLLENCLCYITNGMQDAYTNRVVIYRMQKHMEDILQKSRDASAALDRLRQQQVALEKTLEDYKAQAELLKKDYEELEAKASDSANKIKVKSTTKSRSKKTPVPKNDEFTQTSTDLNTLTQNIKKEMDGLAGICIETQYLAADLTHGLWCMRPNIESHYKDDKHTLGSNTVGCYRIETPNTFERHYLDEYESMKHLPEEVRKELINVYHNDDTIDTFDTGDGDTGDTEE